MSGQVVTNPVVQYTVDADYSGTLAVTVGTGHEGTPPMLFVQSDLLECTLVMSMGAADELGAAITCAVAKARHLLREAQR